MRTCIKKVYTKYRTLILYGLIGGSAAALDVGLFLLLFNIFEVPPLVATVVSIACSTLYSFFINLLFNFRVTDRAGARMVLFFLVSGLGMALSWMTIALLHGNFGINANLAKIVSLPPIVVVQYLLNYGITFRKDLFTKDQEEIEIPVEFVHDPANQDKSVAVLGAGFTGLAAAYRLMQMGYKVTVYEKAHEVGGLVSGFQMHGMNLEKAYHFLYKTDESIIELAQELGIGEKLTFHDSSLSLYYDQTLYPFMTPSDLLRFKPLSFVNRVRAGAVAVYLQVTKNWRQFVGVSAYTWLRRWAGKQVTEVIWEPILRGKFAEYWDQIEMTYVWSRVHVRANSKKQGDTTEQLGYFEGGFKIFVDALLDALAEGGVELHTGVTIDAVSSKSDNRSSVISTIGEHDYDAVLATLPTRVFAKLVANNDQITTGYLEQLGKIGYLGAVTMVFSTDEEISPYYWHNINDIEHPFLVMLSLSALIGTEACGNRHIYYIGSYLPHMHPYFHDMTDEQIRDEWFSGVEQIFANFDRTNVNESHVFRLPYAQHIADVGYQEKIPAYASPIPGVWLANFSQIYPDDRGTNYAVAEANKIATMINTALQANSANTEAGDGPESV